MDNLVLSQYRLQCQVAPMLNPLSAVPEDLHTTASIAKLVKAVGNIVLVGVATA